jgi:hypothetical protein
MDTTFTPEQILQRARVNFSSICLVTASYLKEHNLPSDEFWSYVGARYASSWKQVESLSEVAYQAALNMVSIGCRLRSLSNEDGKAEVVLDEWPSGESTAFFGLLQEEADNMWIIFGPIAESLGYSYEWRRQGDQVTMIFSRQSDG